MMEIVFVGLVVWAVIASLIACGMWSESKCFEKSRDSWVDMCGERATENIRLKKELAEANRKLKNIREELGPDATIQWTQATTS